MKLRNRLLLNNQKIMLLKILYFEIIYDLKSSFQDLIFRMIKCKDIEKEMNNKISHGMTKEI